MIITQYYIFKVSARIILITTNVKEDFDVYSSKYIDNPR